MKKTLLITFVLGLLTSIASAEMKAGITASGYMLDANGKETNNNQKSESRGEDIAGGTVSLFAEYSFGMASIGVDIVPYDIDMGTVDNKRDATGNNPNGTKGTDGQDGTNSATVDLTNNVTVYALVPIEDTAFYLKAGVGYADAKISESMTTNSNYPDTEIYSAHVSLGYEMDLGEAFVRAEAGYSAWEDTTVKSSSGRNQVEVELDGAHARISVGTKF